MLNMLCTPNIGTPSESPINWPSNTLLSPPTVNLTPYPVLQVLENHEKEDHILEKFSDFKEDDCMEESKKSDIVEEESLEESRDWAGKMEEAKRNKE